ATFTFSGDSDCCGFAGPVMTAISNALDRGATVRFIGDSNVDTNALWQNKSLALEAQRGVNPLILSIDDSGAGIHHNKFGLFDYGPGNRWVVSGSANFTGGAMSLQWNTMVEIRDDALYAAYSLEADELLAGRFHDDAAKSHAHDGSAFNIPGSWGANEAYFSPSPDGMPLEDELLALIATAQDEIIFAGNVVTRLELAMALRDAADANPNLRITGVLPRSQTDPGQTSEAPYNFLTNTANYAGTNYVNMVLAHEDRGDTNTVDTGGVAELVHTKWMVIDPTGSQPVVWHGSTNWTFSALVSNNTNDENVQVIRHAGVACRFFDNFKAITARFGSRNCVASNQPPNIVPIPDQIA
ncbi:MAG: phospholipase D-like domain-containing protein, partial [Verrucomicrobiota bacterium]